MKELYRLNPIVIDGKTCSAVAGTVVVGNNIYTIASKSADGKQPIAFYRNDKAIPVRTAAGSTAIARHANSITYYDHLFYVVTRNGQDETQIVAFDSGGIIKKKWKYPRSMIATINHYSGSWFLISVNGGLSVKYRAVEIGKEILDTGREFRVKIPDTEYQTGNDSFYNKTTKRLYVTKFKDEVHNAVFIYDISAIRKEYIPVDVKYYTGKEKFEIEGIGKGMIACVNGVKSGKQNDMVVQLYAK